MKLDYEIINFVYPSVSLDLLMWSMFFFFLHSFSFFARQFRYAYVYLFVGQICKYIFICE